MGIFVIALCALVIVSIVAFAIFAGPRPAEADPEHDEWMNAIR